MPDPQEELLSLAARRQWAAPYGYDDLQRRLAARQRRHALGQRFALASLAAVGLALLGLLLMSGNTAPGVTPRSDQPLLSAQRLPATQSASMDERWLRGLPTEPAVARFATRLPVAQLEDRIAWLDDSLSIALQERASHSDISGLRSERAQLVDALVRVRYAEQLATQFN